MRKLWMLSVALILMVTPVAAETADADKTIVETAVSAGKFNTLVAAVKAAGLVEALSGPGPLTVFAPTDEAFEKLPKGTIESLLLPENKEKLAAVLKYHVVSGSYPAAKILQNDSLKTLQGQSLAIKQTDKDVMVDQAKVLTTDVNCSNGVIHIIDTVILPKQSSTGGTQNKLRFRDRMRLLSTNAAVDTSGRVRSFHWLARYG